MDVGLAWYRRADYARIREIMADGDSLPPVFHTWQSKAEQVERQAQAAGHVVHRVMVDPDKFVAWCAVNGMHVNSNARRRFAATPANWGDVN